MASQVHFYAEIRLSSYRLSLIIDLDTIHTFSQLILRIVHFVFKNISFVDTDCLLHGLLFLLLWY